MTAYEFFWKRFCAFYVEITKPVLMGRSGTAEERVNKQKLLAIILCQSLRLLHPMAPFITEELFQNLKERIGGAKLNTAAPRRLDPYTMDTLRALEATACMVSRYPEPLNEEDIEPEIEETFERVERTIYALRNIRGEMKIPPSTRIQVHLFSPEEGPQLDQLRDSERIIKALVRTEDVSYHSGQEPEIGFAATALIDNVKILVPLPQEMVEKEKGRLAKEQQRLQTTIEKSRQQLDNADFVAKAPRNLIEKHQASLQQSAQQLEEIEQKLGALDQ